MPERGTSDYLLARGAADSVALTDATRSYTYGELRDAAGALVAELVAARLPTGSRVGLLGGNSFFWVAAYLAILKAGCVAVPFATNLTPENVTRNARLVDVAAMVVDDRLARRLGAAAPPGMPIFTEAALATAPRWPDRPGQSADSDAVLMFTSGTTATPRAVQLSHDNIRANTDSIIAYLGLRRADRMLVILPFFYCFGLSVLHTHLRSGASVVLCNSFAFPETAVEMITRHGCTGIAGVPSSYQLLLRASSFATRELPTLRHMQQAGGKLAPVLVEELVAAHPQARLFVMYGQTEATARLSYLPPEETLQRIGSIGRGIPGVTLRVTRESGAEVVPGEIGEIRASGRNIAKGYWNDPEGTAAKFVDGELRTGDLATVDADGYVYVVDRKDDFIKSWGHRVSSQEIEAAVSTLEDIVSVAAVGVRDEEAGEAIVLFCTVRPGSVLGSADVSVHCRQRLPKHMVPRVVNVLDTMPLNSNGKIVKAALRDIAMSTTSAPS